MYHFQSKLNCYSNIYLWSIVEVIIFKVRFQVIKDFATSPNFEKSRKRFNYESEKSVALQKNIICLQCYLTIPRRITIIYDNQIDLNKHKDVLKYLNEVSPSDYWFPYKYIDAEVNNKVEKPKDNSQAMKCKRILNITWNLSISIPTG